MKSQKRKSQCRQTKLFLSCEHAGNLIPNRYKKLFSNNKGVLKTHRGSDPGAFEVAKYLQQFTKTSMHFTTVSRLVVDMNRSPESPTALSRWTKSLSKIEQHRIFETIYWPYRNEVYDAIAKILKAAPKRRSIEHNLRTNAKAAKLNRPQTRVLHFGIHSFSPYIERNRTSCDIGILFDPKSKLESRVANQLQSHLGHLFPELGLRMNFPYRGDGDGLTTDLRKMHAVTRFKTGLYAGLEIEFNQAFLRKIKKNGTLRIFSKNFALCLTSLLTDL